MTQLSGYTTIWVWLEGASEDADPLVEFCWPAVPRVGEAIWTPEGPARIRSISWGAFRDGQGHVLDEKCVAHLMVEIETFDRVNVTRKDNHAD